MNITYNKLPINHTFTLHNFFTAETAYSIYINIGRGVVIKIEKSQIADETKRRRGDLFVIHHLARSTIENHRLLSLTFVICSRKPPSSAKFSLTLFM